MKIKIIPGPSRATIHRTIKRLAEKKVEGLPLIPLTNYSLPTSALPGTRLKELEDFCGKLDRLALNVNGGNDYLHWCKE